MKDIHTFPLLNFRWISEEFRCVWMDFNSGINLANAKHGFCLCLLLQIQQLHIFLPFLKCNMRQNLSHIVHKKCNLTFKQCASLISEPWHSSTYLQVTLHCKYWAVGEWKFINTREYSRKSRTGWPFCDKAFTFGCSQKATPTGGNSNQSLPTHLHHPLSSELLIHLWTEIVCLFSFLSHY